MKPNEVQRKHKVALLIIDMFNTFDFPEGKKLLKLTKPAAENILRLKRKLKNKAAIIYLNDNFGQWRSDSKEVISHCSKETCIGKEIAEILKPSDDEYFILKPRHSGFFSTNLEIFLADIGAEKLIITGIAGNICVMFTANDAHMRDFKIWVPRDCIASNTAKENEYALRIMHDLMGVKIVPSTNSSSLQSFLKS